MEFRSTIQGHSFPGTYELGCYPGSETCRQGSGLLLLTADVEKIAELASAADGLYGMTRSCYGSGWFSPSSSQNRNFAIVAKKPKWNRVTNCRWTLRYDKIMLWVRVVRGTLIWASYHPLTLKIGSCKVFFAKTLNRIELLLTADVEKIAELASAADGLYGMTKSYYWSGWFSPSNFQNRNFAIAAKKP